MSFFKSISISISSIFNIFKKPYHSSTLSFRGLLHSVAVAVAVFVAFYIFQPFGIKELAESEKTLILATSGVITLATMIICQFLLPVVLKSFYDEHHWTGGKQLTQFLLMSAFISFGLNYYLNTQTSVAFPIEGLKIFGISIIPLVMLIFVQE